ncbi:heavy metal-binding domain-containing protein [Shewanella mesophila]|uniref:heavy metal-binding domain-containing protein n=1 Tax=Shewanella mesophila TaxID=2864208 RepID=UPI0021ACC6E1|nr:heavy metal-binding domain-containing protein [Shewanella mesophila]
MKTLISLVLTAFIFTISVPMVFAENHAQHEHHGQNYHCPMHPEVKGEKGDTCPKCGMNLEQVGAMNGHHDAKRCDNCPKHQQAQHMNAAYDCPMHPEVTGKKGDTCPKCGMNLEKKVKREKTDKAAEDDAQHQHH